MRLPISERYNIDEKETPQSWKETGLRSFYCERTDGEKQQKRVRRLPFCSALTMTASLQKKYWTNASKTA